MPNQSAIICCSTCHQIGRHACRGICKTCYTRYWRAKRRGRSVRRIRNPDGPRLCRFCQRCGKKIDLRSKSDYCGPCRKGLVCYLCGKLVPDKTYRACDACERGVDAFLAAMKRMNAGPHPTPSDIDERIAYHRARVEREMNELIERNKSRRTGS